ncbi:MAG: MATE family efflux transporter [Oscillospiraceae bacterium]|nr:MATE family efflux transporter [Oscillospiraceae bacterium]
MSSSLKKDLTVGNVVKQLAAFSIPTLLANVLQALYGLADMIVVGQFIGDAGLSATGLCSEVMIVISATSTGICTGGTVVLAQYMGLKDSESQKATISTLFILMCGIAAALTALGIALTPGIVQLMRTPVEAVEQANRYLSYSCGGIVFIFGYNVVCSVLRGLGNSKIPMYIIGFASVLNVLLDLLLVGVCGMDVGGAALATVIAQGVAFGLALWYMKDLFTEFEKNSFVFDRQKARLILKIGVPNMLQTTLVHVSMVFVGAIISTYGVTASAASAIGQKMSSISTLARQAISAGVSTMTGQNMSAGKTDRVESVVKTGVVFSFAANLILFAVVSIFPETVAGIFTKDNAVMGETIKYLRIVAVSYLVMSPMTVFNALAIGVGNSKQSMFNSLLDSVICRMPLCVIMGYFFGLTGVYIALATSPISAVLSGGTYFFRRKWKKDYLLKT